MTVFNGTVNLCDAKPLNSRGNIFVRYTFWKLTKNVEPPLKCPMKLGTYVHKIDLQMTDHAKAHNYVPTFLKTVGSSYINITYDVFAVMKKKDIPLIKKSDLIKIIVKN
jgi:hypothetical protein